MSKLPEVFIESISLALNLNKVPCVLWGHCLLNVHGVPSIIAAIDFIIPDGRLNAAIETLAQIESLTTCQDESICLASSDERYTPPPAFHLHITDSDVTVDLYLQSETIWFLPSLENSLFSGQSLRPSPYFALASDRTSLPLRRPGRGSGAFASSNNQVVVLKAHVLLEAFLRLYARDAKKRVGSFGLAMVAYVEQYVDDDGFLDVKLLSEPFRTFYRDLREGNKPTRQWTKELRIALGIREDPSDSEGD